MRPLWKDILIAVWLGMIVPGIVLNAFVLKDRHRQIQQMEWLEPTENPEPSVSVCHNGGSPAYLPLNEYLVGVLLAEMPADFHPEALKAQSVAARTYTWKAVTTAGKHADGIICTDFACCQGYISEEDYLLEGGTRENLDKIRQAVYATDSMVLSHDGELIEATYFSASNGSTEAAVAVWGTEYPYLQPVSSPESDQREQSLSFSPEEFQHLLGKTLSAPPEEWFGRVTYTDGGGVATVEICEESYTGTQLRAILGLRSTAFHILVEGQNIVFRTRGYGHRVGMSQYGADAMAQSGSSWQQILQHYYPGTVLHPMT